MTHLARRTASIVLVTVALSGAANATDLPPDFQEHMIVDGLVDPAVIAFAPDGRLFIGERIEGRLRVAIPAGADDWTLLPDPFYVFDIPKSAAGEPERHRSSGLRGFAFDPDFAMNGFVYAFYMKDVPRHNRVVRIAASAVDPNVAESGETVLLDLPFSGTESSGSHNGGAIAFGADDHLYVTTGDGWNGGDDVQSLSTFTGKVYRIMPDGTIPTDNPFYASASGAYRAIYALGLRNPFSMSRHPFTGQLYVHDVVGGRKADTYALAAGANYGHDGYDGIGAETSEWVDAGLASSSGRVITGGAWYPTCGPLPAEYHGSCFVSLWGSNGTSTGSISVIASDTDPTVSTFATNIGFPDPAETLKPISIAISPGGRLVYLASSYEADGGMVMEVRSTAPPAADLNADGVTNFADLLVVIGSWGACTPGVPCPADLDGDCTVGFSDVLALITAWT